MSYPAKILLIKLVKQHESIWNTRSQYYARSDLKTQAWNEIAEKMQANGFESKVGRLKVMWKNLRDQWKRNLTLKMPPEREWYFQRKINFLAGTYEDGELAHCPHTSDASPEIQEAPDDSLYDVKIDAFENGYTIEGSTLMGESPNTPIRELKSEMKEDDMTCEQALVTVLSEGGTPRMPAKLDNLSGPAFPSLSAQGTSANFGPPPVKRTRMETRSEAANVLRQRDGADKNGSFTKPPQDATNGQTRTKSEKEYNDKYDKYAAFVSTTLREMPETEAKRRMREMTMLLLEDVDLNV